MIDSPLGRRRRDLATIAGEELDVLVIGGGIVGCGVLLDAATRGLRAALVERDDIASGTSSRSSRLIHGGLRYLGQLRFGLVRESLAERARLLRLAPHLVTIEPLLFPLIGPPVLTRAFYQAGMTVYDLLGARRDGGWHRHLSVAEVLQVSPAMRRGGLRGGLLFHDAVEDDARYALTVARTAQAAGATVVTRARAEGLVVRDGRVTGARVRDLVDGGEADLGARVVVDATGVWNADPSQPLAGGSTRLRPSRGAHLVVRRERIPSRHGMTIRVPGRIVFLVPWPRHWLIGTTDLPDDGPIDRPRARRDEVESLLATVNRVLDVDLRRDDVVGTYAGLRPLIAPSHASASTVRASREHRVTVEPTGLVRVSGGKYTTYRVMAAQAVDAALKVLGQRPVDRPSRTADHQLLGAADRPELSAIAGSLARRHGLPPTITARLVDRHGTAATEIVAMGAAEGLLAPLSHGLQQIEAEVVWAARRELALGLDDVLARRMRLAQELPDRGAAIAGRVAALLGAELGWDAERREREVAEYLAGARREYGVP